jgi:hypothetical protein
MWLVGSELSLFGDKTTGGRRTLRTTVAFSKLSEAAAKGASLLRFPEPGLAGPASRGLWLLWGRVRCGSASSAGVKIGAVEDGLAEARLDGRLDGLVSSLFSSLLLGRDDTPMLWLCPALEDISKGECPGPSTVHCGQAEHQFSVWMWKMRAGAKNQKTKSLIVQARAGQDSGVSRRGTFDATEHGPYLASIWKHLARCTWPDFLASSQSQRQASKLGLGFLSALRIYSGLCRSHSPMPQEPLNRTNPRAWIRYSSQQIPKSRPYWCDPAPGFRCAAADEHGKADEPCCSGILPGAALVMVE